MSYIPPLGLLPPFFLPPHLIITRNAHGAEDGEGLAGNETTYAHACAIAAVDRISDSKVDGVARRVIVVGRVQRRYDRVAS